MDGGWSSPIPEMGRLPRTHYLAPTTHRQQATTSARFTGPDLKPGLWWAAGPGGFGVSGCYAVGEAVATWLLGGDTAWLHRGSVAPGRPMPARWLLRPDGDFSAAKLVDGR